MLHRIFNIFAQNSDNPRRHHTCPMCGGFWLVEVLTGLMMGLCVSLSYFDWCLQAVKVMFAIVAALYLLYLIYLLVRAYAELRSMPYFG